MIVYDRVIWFGVLSCDGRHTALDTRMTRFQVRELVRKPHSPRSGKANISHVRQEAGSGPTVIGVDVCLDCAYGTGGFACLGFALHYLGKSERGNNT